MDGDMICVGPTWCIWVPLNARKLPFFCFLALEATRAFLNIDYPSTKLSPHLRIRKTLTPCPGSPVAPRSKNPKTPKPPKTLSPIDKVGAKQDSAHGHFRHAGLNIEVF